MAKVIKIDTSDNKKIFVELGIDGRKTNLSQDSSLLKSEACLPLINKLLTENNIKLNELDNVEVNTGPGSFTGLRVGASIANAFSYLLKIPVNGKKIGELADPIYND